jgi:hypothetical protein
VTLPPHRDTEKGRLSGERQLANTDLYDKLVQKRVTMLAIIRHKAAHGDMGSFTDTDVSDTIAHISRFVGTDR